MLAGSAPHVSAACCDVRASPGREPVSCWSLDQVAGDKEGGPSPHGVHVPTREWTQNPSNLAVAARARGIKLLRRSLPRTYALVGGGGGAVAISP